MVRDDAVVARLAKRPTRDVRVPFAVAQVAAGDDLEAVWENELGGLTFRLAAGTPRDRYVKWVPAGTPDTDLAGEASRRVWIKQRVPVPAVLDYGSDQSGAWLETAAIPAVSAVHDRWKADPGTAGAAIGVGLRELHGALPVEGCPYRWDVSSRLHRARRRIDAGEGPRKWFPEHRHLTVPEAWTMLCDPPPVDCLVVCHGDACAPNTLLDDRGQFAAHVDLGHLGVADRWADLAVAAWSTECNYGPGFDEILYDAYGVAADPDRIRYYRLLWDIA